MDQILCFMQMGNLAHARIMRLDQVVWPSRHPRVNLGAWLLLCRVNDVRNSVLQPAGPGRGHYRLEVALRQRTPCAELADVEVSALRFPRLRRPRPKWP